MKLLNKVGSTVQALVKEGAAAAPKIDRLNDVLHKASVGSSAKKPLMKGVEVVLEAEGGNVLGTRRLVDTTLNAGLAGKQAVAKGDAAAEAIVRQTKNSPELPYSSLAKTDAKLTVQAPDVSAQAVDNLLAMKNRGVQNVDKLNNAFHKASGPQARGHGYNAHVGARDPDVSAVSKQADVTIKDPRDETTTLVRKLEIDVEKTFKDGPLKDKKIIIETKDLKRPLSADYRTKKQILKMEAYSKDADNLVAEAWIQVRNGQATEGLLRYAAEHGVKVVDDAGVLLNGAFFP